MLVWSRNEDKLTWNKPWNITWMYCTDLLTKNSRPDTVMLRENNYFCSLWHQCGDINVRPGLLNPAESSLEQQTSSMTFRRASAASWSITPSILTGFRWIHQRLTMIRGDITNTWTLALFCNSIVKTVGVRGQFNTLTHRFSMCKKWFFKDVNKTYYW